MQVRSTNLSLHHTNIEVSLEKIYAGARRETGFKLDGKDKIQYRIRSSIHLIEAIYRSKLSKSRYIRNHPLKQKIVVALRAIGQSKRIQSKASTRWSVHRHCLRRHYHPRRLMFLLFVIPPLSFFHRRSAIFVLSSCPRKLSIGVQSFFTAYFHTCISFSQSTSMLVVHSPSVVLLFIHAVRSSMLHCRCAFFLYSLSIFFLSSTCLHWSFASQILLQ